MPLDACAHTCSPVPFVCTGASRHSHGCIYGQGSSCYGQGFSCSRPLSCVHARTLKDIPSLLCRRCRCPKPVQRPAAQGPATGSGGRLNASHSRSSLAESMLVCLLWNIWIRGDPRTATDRARYACVMWERTCVCLSATGRWRYILAR